MNSCTLSPIPLPVWVIRQCRLRSMWSFLLVNNTGTWDGVGYDGTCKRFYETATARLIYFILFYFSHDLLIQGVWSHDTRDFQ